MRSIYIHTEGKRELYRNYRAPRTLLSYPSLVLASPTLKCVGLKVRYGNEPTEITDVDTVGIGGSEQPLVKKLSSSVSNLTVSLHLTESQTSITAETNNPIWTKFFILLLL